MIFEINMEAFTTTSTSCSGGDSNKELKRQPNTGGSSSRIASAELDKALKFDQQHNRTAVTLSRRTVEGKLLEMISNTKVSMIPTRAVINFPNIGLTNVLTQKFLNMRTYL